MHALIDSLTSGGAELLLSEFAAVAPAEGIDLTVGYLQSRAGDPAAALLREAGVEPTFIGIPAALTRPAALRRVHAHLRSVAPDLVHTHLGTADFLGGLAAAALRLPALSTIHSAGPRVCLSDDPRARLRRDMISAVRRRCTRRTVAVSDAAARNLVAQGWAPAKQVVTVNNGVARVPRPGAGARVREELGLAPDALVAATISALRPEKAHEAAVEAVAVARKRFPSLRLLIVGEGASRPAVERAAAALGDAALLTGYRADVMSVLDAVDVLLHPSHQEAFPTSLLEAMAAKVPVVATAVGGTPEIVADGATGLLVAPPPAAARVAPALERLLGDPDLRQSLATAGRRRFTERFTAEAWARRMRAVYDEVLEDGSAGARS